MRILLVAGLIASLCPALGRAQTAPPPAAPEAYPPAVAPPPAAPPPTVAPAPPPAAPPPGYGYPAPMIDPVRAQATAELQQVDMRIAALRQQQAQYSLGGPIAMTAAGFGIGVIFASISLVDWAIAENIQHGDCGYYIDRDYDYDSSCDVDDDGEIDRADEDKARMLSRTFGAISAIAGGVGIWGAVLLGKRMSERRIYQPEIKTLGIRRKQLLQQLKYGGYVQYGGLTLTVGGRF